MSDLVNQPDPLLQDDELPTFCFALEKSEGKRQGGSYGKGRSEINDFDPGDIPTGYGHSIENDSDDKPARLLVAFNTGHYEAIDLSLWLAANPDYVLAANFGVPPALIEKLPHHRVFIAGKDGPEKQPPPQPPDGLR